MRCTGELATAAFVHWEDWRAGHGCIRPLGGLENWPRLHSSTGRTGERKTGLCAWLRMNVFVKPNKGHDIFILSIHSPGPVQGTACMRVCGMKWNESLY